MIESAHIEPLSLRSAGEICMAEECKDIPLQDPLLMLVHLERNPKVRQLADVLLIACTTFVKGQSEDEYAISEEDVQMVKAAMNRVTRDLENWRNHLSGLHCHRPVFRGIRLT